MNLLIVDDEQAARTGLVRLCERAADLHVVGEAETGAKAIQAAGSLRPDLVLLDSELPDMSGFDVLRSFRPREQRRTILVTGNRQEVSTAFAAGAVDYLVKPVEERAFTATISRARARLRRCARIECEPLDNTVALVPGPELEHARPLFLVGERERRLYPLQPAQVDYIESAGNYVKYHRANTDYIARESIKRLDVLLGPLGFLRIERSLLLNMHAIAYAQPLSRGSFCFTLYCGARLRSGHAYRDDILAALPLRRRAPRRGGERARTL